MRRSRSFVGALALCAAMVSTAGANGRPPATMKVVFRPGMPSEALIGVTFGLLWTKDDGATWRWMCDSPIGIMGTYDPDYEMTPTGLILATAYDGLYMTRDGCHWTLPPGPLGMGTTSADAIADDGTIYATLSDPVAGYKIFKSTTDGASFADISAGLPQADWWSDIAVAHGPPPHRIYATGFRIAGGRQRILVRSMDGGATWENLPTTAFVGTNNSELLIAAVHPTNPNVVFLHMNFVGTTLEESIYRTANGDASMASGGPTWAKVLDLNDNIPGLTVRSNGDVLAVATMTHKLELSTNGGVSFNEVPGVDYNGECIAERPSDHQLFMCMHNLIGSGALTEVGRSPTGAADSWSSYLRFVDVTAPVRCDAGTLQHDDCEAVLWCGTREQLGATSNEIDCSTPVDAGVDGPDQPPPGKKGCTDCSGGGPTGIAAALGVLLFLPRRRRPGRARH